MEITLEGVDALVARLRRLVGVIDGPETEKRLLAAARVIRDEARRRAPVVTGALRDSIVAKKFSRQEGHGPGAFVAIDYRKCFYAHMVEHGTSKAAPHPFFRPAIDATKGRVVEILKEGVRDVIEEAVARG